MNIKKFIAGDAHEALKLVKRDMGPEAVILSTKTISSSSKNGGRRKHKIEVTAAVDYEAPVVTATDPTGARGGLQKLEFELAEIKTALLCADAGNTLTPEFFFNRELRDKYTNFKTFGLKPEIIRELMQHGNQADRKSEKTYSRLLQESLVHVLSRIHVDEGGLYHKGRRIYTFIGPTGVGKTTTLAKLAASSSIQRGEKTALITLDTFRIAATAQLQTYARIMGIPLEVAVDSDDLQKAVDKHNDCEKIYIDTAGRSPNNKREIEELKKCLGVDEDIHPFLVLSANTEYQSLLNAEKRFGAVPYKSYIFTKLDETQDISTVVNFLISRRRPVSFFTTGQQVPEDIEIASKKKLATLLLSGMSEMPNKSINMRKRDGSSHWP